MYEYEYEFLFLTLPTYAAQRDSEGLTPLHRAAGEGNIKKLENLLNSDSDLFALESKMGVSILHKAVYSGNAKAVEFLLKRGALVNLQSPLNVDTPLQFTTILEKYELDQQSPEGRELMIAIKANDKEKVKTLLAKEKLDLSVADEQGFTPLLWASREGFVEIVAELLKYKADPNQNDQWMGANSGHKAGFWGRTGVMEVLVKNGLDVNARGGYNGYTALHDAVARNHFETTSVLIKAGAKTNIKGHDGKTALDLVKANGNPKIIELLKFH